MEFRVALSPYMSGTCAEILRVLRILDPLCAPSAGNYKTLSTILIVIGLLPVITIPLFHIWLLVIGFPPVLIVCIVCLIAGIVLRTTHKQVRVKEKYLKIAPTGDNSGYLRFDEEGVELHGGAAGLYRMGFNEFTALYKTASAYLLVCADQKLIVVPHKDFRAGLPAEFGGWMSQKIGRPVEYVK